MILKYISEYTVGGVTTPSADYTHSTAGITCRWNMDGFAITLSPNITCCHNGVEYTNSTTLTYQCLGKSSVNIIAFQDAKNKLIMTCEIYACINNEERGNYLVTATKQFQLFCQLIKMEEDIVTMYWDNKLTLESLENFDKKIHQLTDIPEARRKSTTQLIVHYRAQYIQKQLLTENSMSDAWYNRYVRQHVPQLF